MKGMHDSYLILTGAFLGRWRLSPKSRHIAGWNFCVTKDTESSNTRVCNDRRQITTANIPACWDLSLKACSFSYDPMARATNINNRKCLLKIGNQRKHFKDWRGCDQNTFILRIFKMDNVTLWIKLCLSVCLFDFWGYSQLCCWGFSPSEMWRCIIGLVAPSVSEEGFAVIVKDEQSKILRKVRNHLSKGKAAYSRRPES
jgi:hypothetical protein